MDVGSAWQDRLLGAAMSAAVHAEHRRRLYLAMLEHPEGITAEDFAHTPALDGGEWIPRVAPRMHELRAEHTIPPGLRRGPFALYRLDQAGTPTDTSAASVTPINAGQAPHRARDGFTPVTFCRRCLNVFSTAYTCPQGVRVELMQSGTGPTADRCPIPTSLQEERHAA